MEKNDILHDLDEVEFPTKLRGYDPFEVDGVLERARQEILELRERAQTADDRARSAEEQLDAELIAARQAHGEADAALSAAKAEATRMVVDAQTKADCLTAASEAEIRETIELGRNQLHEELALLQSRRDEILDNIDLVELQIAAHRDRLLGAIGDIGALIEGLTVASCPATLMESRSEPSTFLDDDSVESPTIEAGQVSVVRRMQTLSTTVEAGNSVEPGHRVTELPRLPRRLEGDTAGIEMFSSDRGGEQAGTGGP